PQCRRCRRRPRDRHGSRQGRRGRRSPRGARQSGERLYPRAVVGEACRRPAARAPTQGRARARADATRTGLMSMQWNLRRLALAATALLAPFFADGAAAQTPKRGGTAIVAVSVAGPTLNTQMTSTITPLIVADLWADGLFSYDAKGEKVPRIAKSW